MRISRQLAVLVLASLVGCGPKSTTPVTPILPGDGDDNTAPPTDPVGPKTAADPWAKADLIDGPTAKPPTKLDLPPIERFTLKNGLQVLVVKSEQLPIVSMQLAIKTGRADEPHTKLGVSTFTAQMLDKGTGGKKKKSALDIAKAIDFVGGGLESNASYEATLVSCSTLKKDMATCMSLLPDVVIRPTFPKDEMPKVRNEMITEVRARLDDPAALAGAHFQNLLWGEEHVRGWVASEQSIAAISRDDLVKWHKTWYSPSNAILAVAGDGDVAALKKQLEKAFGAWKTAKVPARASYAEPKLDHVLVRLVDRPRLNKKNEGQTEIRIGHFGIKHTDPRFFDSLVWNYALGGGVFSSRLMTEIRAKHGKTYGASSTFDRNLDRGSFVAATATKSSAVIETVNLVKDELEKMAKDGPTEAEVADAIANIAGSYPLRFESANDVAGALLAAELHGLHEDYLESFPVKVGAVTVEGAKAAAAEILDPARFVIVLVGDATELEPLLEKEGWRYEKVRFTDPISLPAQVEASPDDVKKAIAFLDDALKVKGGKKITGLKSLHLEGKGQMIVQDQPPLDVTVSRTFEAPDKMRVDVEFTDGTETQAVSYATSGTTGWHRGVDPTSGKVVVTELVPEQAAALSAQRWHDPELILTRHLEKGAKVTPLPDEKITLGKDKVTCAVINVTSADNQSTATLWIDRKTKLIVQMAYPDGNDVTLDAFGDYREVSGVMIAHKRTSQSSVEGVALSIEKAEIDPTVDATIFAKPAK